ARRGQGPRRGGALPEGADCRLGPGRVLRRTAPRQAGQSQQRRAPAHGHERQEGAVRYRGCRAGCRDRTAAEEERALRGYVPPSGRTANRGVPAPRAALRLRRQRESRRARHHADRAHRNGGPDLAHRAAAHRAHGTARTRRRSRARLMAGILYAIPTPLGGSAADALPQSVLKTVRTLQYFVVENAKSARAFLKDAGSDPKAMHIEELTDESNLQDLMKPLLEGHSVGLLSEAGCPAIADPGALLVEAAHQKGIRVVPLVGPSSIVLALMASGLEGQRFAFCGYLPGEPEERRKKIREIEARSRRERETQIFIETPYRNDVLLGTLLEPVPKGRICASRPI